MPNPTINIQGLQIILLPERVAFLPNLKTLIISDLHLGKINHFRKSGIPVPIEANKANTELLIKLLMELKPKKVIFIGDLFHSHYNSEWEVLGQVIQSFHNTSFELVPGNHDIMSDVQYQKHNIKILELQYPVTPNIILTHEPVKTIRKGKYYISGHIHPAVTLHGKARQSLTFPCFWFGKQQGYLPAFGVFTGFKKVHPESGDQIFGIVNGKVIEVDLATI